MQILNNIIGKHIGIGEVIEISERLGTCRSLNRTINTSTAEQGLIGGIDKSLHLHFCYVISYYFKRHNLSP